MPLLKGGKARNCYNCLPMLHCNIAGPPYLRRVPPNKEPVPVR